MRTTALKNGLKNGEIEMNYFKPGWTVRTEFLDICEKSNCHHNLIDEILVKMIL